MAARAYVLIETSVGKTKDVALALRKLKGVREANAVTGAYDVIAVVEGADLSAIGNLVVNEIRLVGGVVDTVTYMAVDFT